MLFLSILIGNCIAALNLTIGIDINNKESLAYLGRLEQHYEQFEEKGCNPILIQLSNLEHPESHSAMLYMQTKTQTQPEQHCFGGGRYCQFSTYANGQLLLTEILRQHCLFTYETQLILSYINLFQQDCFENPHYTFCSENILNKLLNINITKVNECINASFKEEGDQVLLENTLLAKEMDKQYNQSQLNVYLDNKDISDKTFPEMIVYLCQKLKDDPPEYCNIFSLLEKNTTLKLDDHILFALFIVLLILLIMISIRVLKRANNVIQDKQSIPVEETIGIISGVNEQ